MRRISVLIGLVAGVVGFTAGCDESVGAEEAATVEQAQAPGWQDAWGAPALVEGIAAGSGLIAHETACGFMAAHEWAAEVWTVGRIETFCSADSEFGVRTFVRIDAEDGSEAWLTTVGGGCADDTMISTRFGAELGERLLLPADVDQFYDPTLEAAEVGSGELIRVLEDGSYRFPSGAVTVDSFDELVELGEYPDTESECPAMSSGEWG